MTEFIELLKTVGPALGILIWLVFQLWKECGEKEKKLEQMYERLIESEKQHFLDLIRGLTAQFKNEKDNFAQPYIEALKQKAVDLKLEIESMRKTK